MKMNQKLSLAALALFMSLASDSPVEAQETTVETSIEQAAYLDQVWQYSEGEWSYYIWGQKCVGKYVIGDDAYYFDQNGVMQTGWVLIDGTWQYYDVSGAAVRGWLKLNDSWYYLDFDDEMATGWLEINDTWYFFVGTGEMLTNAILGDWEIDGSGVAVEIVEASKELLLSYLEAANLESHLYYDYTPISWFYFNEALADAEAVYYNSHATDEEIKAGVRKAKGALDLLAPACNGFYLSSIAEVIAPSSEESKAYEAAYTWVNGVKKENSNYYESGWVEFRDAYEMVVKQGTHPNIDNFLRSQIKIPLDYLAYTFYNLGPVK